MTMFSEGTDLIIKPRAHILVDLGLQSAQTFLHTVNIKCPKRFTKTKHNDTYPFK